MKRGLGEPHTFEYLTMSYAILGDPLIVCSIRKKGLLHRSSLADSCRLLRGKSRGSELSRSSHPFMKHTRTQHKKLWIGVPWTNLYSMRKTATGASHDSLIPISLDFPYTTSADWEKKDFRVPLKLHTALGCM